MAFQVSPGVNVSEIDLTTVVPAVSTTTGAIAGVFSWGPIDKFQLVTSENVLANLYGKPTADNYETWFSAANFLAYSGGMYVSRAADVTDDTGVTGVLSAVANTAALSTPNTANMIINADDYDEKIASIDSSARFIARYPGALGNSLKVSVCDTANAYGEVIDLNNYVAGLDPLVASNSTFVPTATGISIDVGSATANIFLTATTTAPGFAVAGVVNTSHVDAFIDNLKGNLVKGDYIEFTDANNNKQKLKIKELGNADSTGTANTSYTRFVNVVFETPYNLATDVTTDTFAKYWEYYNVVDGAPGQSDYVYNARGTDTINDELHVVIVDEDGKFTGVPGQVLEVYQNLSRATDAKTSDGASLYFRDIINEVSNYAWVGNDIEGAAANTAANLQIDSNRKPTTLSFQIGSDGANESSVGVSNILRAYDVFKDGQSVDIGLVISGKPGGTDSAQIGKYLIDNIAESRKDCLVFISPPKSAVLNNAANAAAAVTTFRDKLGSSSYAVMDSGYKYQYDKYNDVYRWVPLNGDVAGIVARTDDLRDPWFSPAGFNRGQVKNLVKLAWNPTKEDRDVLYKKGVNPVVTFPAQGTVLYGDKTLLSRSSAFDRINVRRLFIILEKSIANAANSLLFEFNDEFTRLQFLNTVEPFLRDVKGRRGIYDFKVVCDETNNTGEVIDSNRFVGDIYIKPARSINFIQLNFVAVRTGVEFSEIVGQF